MEEVEKIRTQEFTASVCLSQQKKFKCKGFKKPQAESNVNEETDVVAPEATYSDYVSAAAQVEQRAAQVDDERPVTEQEDASEDGDTDSLMEWWYTVERWDEVPPDEEGRALEENESRSFTMMADKVFRGLRLFHRVFTERAELLWQLIIILNAIADDISEFQKKANTCGTTITLGSVLAVSGLLLVPFTLGLSLVVTAVGMGAVTAGGITAVISDSVGTKHGRKRGETARLEYEDHLLELRRILHFINQGLTKLRNHPVLRSGTQDWEIRTAVQTISLVEAPVLRATQAVDIAVASVQALFQDMSRVFSKRKRELKGFLEAEIRSVAFLLHQKIVELNAINGELLEATGRL
ncbi:apolipoprotein L6-like [Aulostomus maculatus]